MAASFDPAKLTKAQRTRIVNELTVSGKETKHGPGKTVTAFFFVDSKTPGVTSKLHIPMWYAKNVMKLDIKYTSALITPERCVFGSSLRDYQVSIAEQALKHLKKSRSVLLELYTGFGKSAMAIYLIIMLRRKAAFISPRVLIIKQIIEECEMFGPKLVVQWIKTGSTKINPNADIYLMSQQMPHKLLGKPGVIDQIGTVIVDEVHMGCSDITLKNILSFKPGYLIGMSATPDRDDGLSKIFDNVYGPRVVKKLDRAFKVHCLRTRLNPKIENGANGIDWGKTLSWQVEHHKRNQAICYLINEFHTKRTLLVLCKRKDHVDRLHKILLNQYQINAEKLYGSTNDYDKTAKVILASFSKAGTGYSHKALDCLILAGDVVNPVQYVGRILRKADGDPFVIDFCDEGIMYTHYLKRKKMYTSLGGKISQFTKSHPKLTKGLKPHLNLMKKAEKPEKRANDYKSTKATQFSIRARYMMNK